MDKNTNRETSVRIAKFKAHLSRYLRAVRSGHELTILDRDTPVARVLPYDDRPGRLKVLKASRRVEDVRLPPPLRRKVDSLAALREERRERL